MTISNTSRTAGPFIGNGITQNFPFSFKVFSAKDVLVAKTVTATGVETILTLDSDYTITLNPNQNSDPGGAIQMKTAPPVGTTLAATSDISVEQTLDLTNNGGFYPQAISNALDRIVIMIQQLAARVGLGALNIGAAAQLAAIVQFISDLKSSAGAGLVGFLQAGVGAVLRTIYAKLLPVIEPEDFGAIGDGVTDDTGAFTKMATRVRTLGGGFIRFGAGKTYYVLPTGGTYLGNLIDLENCRGVTIQGNGATIKTGNVQLAQNCIGLKSTFGVLIENLNFLSGYFVLDGTAGIDWIAASYGAKRITMRNLNFQYGCSGFVARGAYIGQGVDTNRVAGIEMLNCSFDTTYYPLAFQGAGDHFFGRGIVTRNAGRSYFPYNVHDHDVVIDSQQGGPFSDCLLKVYGSTQWYSKLENIKLVYKSDGRYPSSGNQSFDEAMISMDFQLNQTNPAPCTFSNIDIQFNVSPGPANRNQNIFYIRKYDGSGNPDSTIRGHTLIGLRVSGVGLNLQNLLAASINLFGRAGENWAGEAVYGVKLHDMMLGNVSSQNALVLNAAPVISACTVERVKSAGSLSLSNIGGKELSITESVFANYATRSQITQSYAVNWTADGTAPNIQAGTLAGTYTVQGKMCTVDLYLKAEASTTFGSGIWHFSLPFTHAIGAQSSVGSAMALDSGSNYFTGVCVVQAGATTMELLLGGTPGNFTNASSPVTWASQDYIRATITYPIE